MSTTLIAKALGGLSISYTTLYQDIVALVPGVFYDPLIPAMVIQTCELRNKVRIDATACDDWNT
jgi:hypothetical protein